ncbi:MAG: hypothetical protein AB8E15_00515 [Bdellovibrionales bacterium]
MIFYLPRSSGLKCKILTLVLTARQIFPIDWYMFYAVPIFLLLLSLPLSSQWTEQVYSDEPDEYDFLVHSRTKDNTVQKKNVTSKPSKNQANQKTKKVVRSIASAPSPVVKKQNDPNLLVGTSEPITKNQDLAPQVDTVEKTWRKIKDEMLGGSKKARRTYASLLDEEDIRKGFWSIGLGLKQEDTASSSQFFPRDYSNSYSLVEIESKVNFSPMTSVSFSYASSFGGSLDDSLDGSRSTSTDVENTKIYLSFHRYENMKPESNSIEYSIGYLDYKTEVLKSSNFRYGHSYSGAFLSAGVALGGKSSNSKINFWLAPSLETSESTSNFGGNSGDLDSSYGAGFEYSWSTLISKDTYFLWSYSSEVFQSNYSGSSSANDPVLGSPVSNVVVKDQRNSIKLQIQWHY